MHQKTPFEAGIFMLPVMVASGFSGPIAGLLYVGLGCARWRPAGCCSAPSAFSAGVDRFQYPAVAGLGG